MVENPLTNCQRMDNSAVINGILLHDLFSNSTNVVPCQEVVQQWFRDPNSIILNFSSGSPPLPADLDASPLKPASSTENSLHFVSHQSHERTHDDNHKGSTFITPAPLGDVHAEVPKNAY